MNDFLPYYYFWAWEYTRRNIEFLEWISFIAETENKIIEEYQDVMKDNLEDDYLLTFGHREPSDTLDKALPKTQIIRETFHMVDTKIHDELEQHVTEKEKKYFDVCTSFMYDVDCLQGVYGYDYCTTGFEDEKENLTLCEKVKRDEYINSDAILKIIIDGKDLPISEVKRDRDREGNLPYSTYSNEYGKYLTINLKLSLKAIIKIVTWVKNNHDIRSGDAKIESAKKKSSEKISFKDMYTNIITSKKGVPKRISHLEDPTSRAIGLWLFDYCKYHRCTRIKAIEAFCLTEHVEKLDYYKNDAHFRRLIKRTRACVEEAEVLTLAKKNG